MSAGGPQTPPWSYPVVVADIGGTNARFALIEAPDATTPPAGIVPTRDFPGIAEAMDAAVLSATSLRPRTALIAVAGPIRGDRIPLTNAPWTIEPRALIEDFGLETVILVNDFEAQALALPDLDGASLRQIGGDAPLPEAPKAVVGPGTGLGVGALFRAMDRWIPVPGEGGHVELGPVTAEEYRLWPHIPRQGTGDTARVSAEHLLSGAGLVRLTRACAAADGTRTDFSSPQEIVAAADAGDALARTALSHFSRALGRIAGDMALVFMARGGVYLAGGIPPHILPYLADGSFRAAFEAKAPHEAIMARIPVYVIHHPQPALVGLAAFARDPDRFAVNLANRMWRAA